MKPFIYLFIIPTIVGRSPGLLGLLLLFSLAVYHSEFELFQGKSVGKRKERREYARRGTEVSLGHKCTREVREGRRIRLYFFRQLSGDEVSKDLTGCRL
jgi:hypothetical protein